MQSAPVYDSAQKKYVGTLDLRDLVPAIVKKGDSDDADGNAGPELLDRILKVSAEMRGLPSDALPLLINPGGFRSVSEEGSLDDATRQLMHKGCYRVSVLNSAGDAINVISQSTVIRSVCGYPPGFGHIYLLLPVAPVASWPRCTASRVVSLVHQNEPRD